MPATTIASSSSSPVSTPTPPAPAPASPWSGASSKSTAARSGWSPRGGGREPGSASPCQPWDDQRSSPGTRPGELTVDLRTSCSLRRAEFKDSGHRRRTTGRDWTICCQQICWHSSGKSLLESRDRLLSGDGGKGVEKLLEAVSGFEVVEQVLQRYAGTDEDRVAPEDFGIACSLRCQQTWPPGFRRAAIQSPKLSRPAGPLPPAGCRPPARRRRGRLRWSRLR